MASQLIFKLIFGHYWPILDDRPETDVFLADEIYGKRADLNAKSESTIASTGNLRIFRPESWISESESTGNPQISKSLP